MPPTVPFRKTALSLVGALALTLPFAGPASAEFDLPSTVALTAYDTGSTGFNQMIAIGGAFKDEAGVSLRVLPGKNDIARAAPLRQGRVPFSAFGVGHYMMQEGVFDFAGEDWGPQPVRMLMTNFAGKLGQAIAVTKTSGIETYEDLRGKRVAWIKGSPALNVNTESYLAYAGLTWDDVEKVEFGGYADSLTGMINGTTDAAFASMTAGGMYQVEASPEGLHWPRVDPANAEGVARMKDVAPYMRTMTATEGAVAETTEGGIPTAGYPYPAMIAMEETDADLVYNFTKAMYETFPAYQGKAPGIDGWALEQQSLEWVVPYHEGAIRYYEEVGAWTEAAQANNERMIERQKVLMDAWAELKAQAPADWDAAWSEARRKALADAGFKPVF
ncbi:TAXI family TRAP transporter solute-binding subunit [Albimonas pacifica]|uniref:TRAP transporter solute receptor, TAXI family n=1 Tax=Albimonas pacifica TaxID=1114924 RepID=A0A1I3C291_9RHOB|nr:TAXI family TRAP transporter solute-binding subunit [Albimonas pacifica]SFH68674.1 TRAP transporter solute receptor, TAXI family [Albimonas pacifica]